MPHTPARPPGPGEPRSTGSGDALRRLDTENTGPIPVPTDADANAQQTHEIGKRTYIVADVEPLDVDGVRTLTVGVILWGIAAIGLLPFYGRLQADGHLWWLWVCLAGLGLGLYGLEYCRRRRKVRMDGGEPLR